MLQISLRRMEGAGLRRVCVVRRAKSCNQSLHDTNVNDGLGSGVRAFLPHCTRAQHGVSDWVENASVARTEIMLQAEELLPGRMHSLVGEPDVRLTQVVMFSYWPSILPSCPMSSSPRAPLLLVSQKGTSDTTGLSCVIR